jgi:hypothetical protein
MEGLICFFMFLRWMGAHTPWGRNPFYRETRKRIKLFFGKSWKFFSGVMASLIAPEKSEVKWYNFAAKSLLLSPKAQVYGAKSSAGVVAHRANRSFLIAHYQVGVYLGYVLGDQTKLRAATGGGSYPQSQTLF